MNRAKIEALSRRYQMVLYDVDRTLVGFDSLDPLPNVAFCIEALNRLNVKQVAVTNQGGPACRDNGFKGEYPTVEQVRRRIDTIVYHLGLQRAYICWAYLTKDLVFYYPAITPPDMDRIDWQNQQAAWRKPYPGMLRQAALDFKVMPQSILMVGDGKQDQEAAKAFGCDFMWAWSFFDWPQPVAENERPTAKPDLSF